MGLTTREENGVVIVTVDGQLIVSNRQQLKQAVIDELDKGATKFVVDFGETGYIDSSGLGLLVTLSKRVGEAGGALRLSSLSDDLGSLFELTKLDTLLDIYDTVEQAVEGL